MSNTAERLTPRRVALVAAVVLAVFGVAHALVLARDVILLGFLSVVVATVLRFPIDWLSRRLPRWTATLLTLIVFIGIAAGIGVLVAPTLRDQAHQLPHALAGARDKLASWWEHRVGDPGAAVEKVEHEAPAQAAKHAPKLAWSVLELASAVVGVVVLAFFLAAAGDRLRVALRRLVPAPYEAVFDECWHRSGTALRRWTGGVLVSMTIMGTLCGFGLWLVGVRSPLILGVVTFSGTFVPYIGGILSSLPGLAVALSQSPRIFLLALGVYVVIHHVEGYIVQPLVMRRAVELRPAVLLFWEALLAAVFGIPGVLVATPLLAALQPLVDYLWVERALGKRAPGHRA